MNTAVLLGIVVTLGVLVALAGVAASWIVGTETQR